MKVKIDRLLPHLLLNVITLISVGFMLFAYNAWAAPSAQNPIPGVISYQGTLTDDAGQPITGNIDMTFHFYNQPTDGAALWTESRTGSNAVPVQNGLFHVMLGSLNPISSTVWTNDQLYLGIQIGSEPEMLPREPLGVVPIAMTVSNHAINGSKLAPTGFGASNGALRNFVVRGPVTEADLTTTIEADDVVWDLRPVVGNTAEMVLLYVRLTDDAANSYFQVWPTDETCDAKHNCPYVRGVAADTPASGFSWVRCNNQQQVKYNIGAYGGSELSDLDVTVIGWVEPAATP